MKYRPEIDGLRFLAVFIVIVYHIRLNLFDINIFQGGFIGVDVFFVISGYLITSIILEDINKNQFNLFNFFERRIRRIIPLLIFISLFFLIIAVIILGGQSLVDLANTVLSSIFFYSNFFFIFKEVEYGVDTNSINPFLHTWSLSIEEQYYILFPLFIILIKKNINFLKISILIFFIMSLVLCIQGYQNYPNVNFFLFSSRIWEILLGSILAFIPKYKFKNIYPSNLLTTAGLILILISAIYFNDIDEKFPSSKNLIPTLGTALIIYFGSQQKNLISKILSFKLFVFFGKVSFSLYLIHMPVISLIRNTDIVSGTVINKFLAMIFILMFSIFTYFFIEKIFRNKVIISKKTLYKYILLAYIILISLIFYINFKNGDVFPIEEKYDLLLSTGKYHEINKISNDCIDHKITTDELKKNEFICSYNKSSNKKIFLIGDSYMINLADVLISNYPKYNYQVHITSGCFFLPNYNKRNKWSKNIDKLCNKDEFSKIKNILLSNKNSVFIFNHRIQVYLENSFFFPDTEWDYYYEDLENNKKIISSKFVNEYRKLTEGNNKIFLIYPTPELEFRPYDKVNNIITLSRFKDNDAYQEIKKIGVKYSDYIKRSKNSIDMYDIALNQNIYKIDPSEFICNEKNDDLCKIIQSNGILYEDDNHLSKFGSQRLAKVIIQKLFNMNF